jgi:hypothetical protein
MQTRKELLVLAAPRSATQYLTMVLRNAQVKVGHEMFKRRGTVGMFFAVEDVFYPGRHWEESEQHQRRSDYVFDQVWHVTRDPRRTIPSIASTALNSQIWPWQERHTGISCGIYPKTLRAMLFWVAWNELIEENEDISYRFRIEDIDEEWPEIRNRMGIADEHEAVPNVPRDYGSSRKLEPLSWDDMTAIEPTAAKSVRAMAERYGYR